VTVHPQLAAVSAEVSAAWVDALLDALSTQPFTPTAWEDVERGTCRIDIFLEDATAAAGVCDTVRETGAALGLTLAPVVSRLAREDWTESWKRFFHVEHVSERVVIRPVWEPYAARPGEVVIDIEPGMSFGTGRHGTTRACLEFIDRISARRAGGSMLDMGCGSGILAIGAAKLGFHPVRGFDNDPDAVAIARDNARLNGIEADLDVCELADNDGRADLVVANILAPVLIGQAEGIARAVLPGPDGALVLSGILEAQYPGVLAAFERLGFHEQASRTIEGWRSGWLSRGTHETT
jgi:ribosomal protein L11 methyltransferase